MPTTRAAVGILAVSAVVLNTGAAYAQNYPTRPVRLLTSEPGGGSDFVARLVATSLSNALGEQVIVDNRPGQQVGPLGAIANPDGYTLIVSGGIFQAAPLITKLDYDPVKSFAGISQLEQIPTVLVVNTSLGVNSVKELIALAKAKPGTLNFGTGGTGGSLHLGGEIFKMITGVDIQRVPYKSTGPALTALLGNEVQMVFSTPPGALVHVKTGKLKALAVTSAMPTPLVPGVPTMIASGVPGFELASIGFILAPAKTPAPIINRLNQEIVRIMAQPDVKEKMIASGTEPVTSTPAQITAKLAADDARLRKLFAALGIKPEN